MRFRILIIIIVVVKTPSVRRTERGVINGEGGGRRRFDYVKLLFRNDRLRITRARADASFFFSARAYVVLTQCSYDNNNKNK